jgi:hypothetical protein
LNLLGIGLDTFARDYVSQVWDIAQAKTAFVGLDFQSCLLNAVKANVQLL